MEQSEQQGQEFTIPQEGIEALQQHRNEHIQIGDMQSGEKANSAWAQAKNATNTAREAGAATIGAAGAAGVQR